MDSNAGMEPSQRDFQTFASSGAIDKANDLDDAYEKIDLEPTQPSAPLWKPSKRFYISFTVICFAFLLSAFECSVVGNVLPSVAGDLNLGNAYIWCSIAFLLSSAIIQPFYAQLQDIFGRKPPLMAAIFVFAAGSGCCGAAKGKATLITGRVIQGLGTSGIDLIGETIVGDLVPLRFRPKWFGIKQGVFAAGTLLGPVLGGVFTQKLSWRWVFWMNVPMCAVAALLIWFALRLDQPHEQSLKDRVKRMKRMDMIGIALLGLILLCGTVSLSDVHPLGTPTSQGLFAAFAVHLLGFIIYQSVAGHSQKRCNKLFMSTHLFRHPRTSLIGLFNITAWGTVVYGVQLVLPIHLQAVKGRQPIKSGYEMLPITALLVACSWGSGYALTFFGNRRGSYKWMQVAGFAVLVLGIGIMIALTEHTNDGLLFTSMVLAAIGSGISIPAILPSIVVELEDADNAVATGNWAFLRSVGSVIGCLLPALCLNYQTRNVAGKVGDPAMSESIMKNGLWNEASADFMQKLPVADQESVREMFTMGLRNTFVAFTAAAGLALLATLAFKSVRMREYNDTRFGLQDGTDVDRCSTAEKGGSG